jgi:hypothetical protein
LKKPLNPEETVWHNLKTADEILNLPYFCASAMAWIKINPTKNYKDLEIELRKKQYNTHLIAKGNKIPNSFIFLRKDDDHSKYKYACIFSCRSPPKALNELLETWQSYEDNLNALEFAGQVVLNDDNNKIPGEIKVNDTMRAVQNNELLLKYKKVTIEEEIENINKIYGKNPEFCIYAMGKNGEPIFVLCIDKKIVAPFGILIGHDHVGRQYTQIINL